MISDGTDEGWKPGFPITTPTQLSKSPGHPAFYLSTYCVPGAMLRSSVGPSPCDPHNCLGRRVHQLYLLSGDTEDLRA